MNPKIIAANWVQKRLYTGPSSEIAVVQKSAKMSIIDYFAFCLGERELIATNKSSTIFLIDSLYFVCSTAVFEMAISDRRHL